MLESVDGLPAQLDEIKTISQSLQVKEVKNNVSSSLVFGEYFAQFEPAYTLLKLPEKATEYYATWVQKATMAQLKQFPSRWKRYLHLLAFIKHQYSLRQDVLMDKHSGGHQCRYQCGGSK